jgi:hypothetical protein
VDGLCRSGSSALRGDELQEPEQHVAEIEKLIASYSESSTEGAISPAARRRGSIRRRRAILIIVELGGRARSATAAILDDENQFFNWLAFATLGNDF